MPRIAARPAAAALAAGALTAACGPNPREARVAGVPLVDATGVEVAADGPVVAVTRAELAPAIPAAPVVRLAIARDVRWSEVQALLGRLEADGVQPVLLVGKRGRVHGFRLEDEVAGPPIQLTSTPDGKFCVGPPDVGEAKCVQSVDRLHISRAYVRETIREAVRAYQLADVDAVLSPDLHWVDVVRTIDGARTCCRDTEVRVRIGSANLADPG
jgi:hypothetical protein